MARRQMPDRMRSYMSDREDSRIQGKVALQSQLPQSDCYQNPDYYGASRSSIGTSQLVSSTTLSTNTDPSGSLPALSSTASSRSYAGSEASYGGGGSTNNWVLEEREGALQIPLTPPAGPLECPLKFLPCHAVFFNFDEWYSHSLTHFGSVGPPCTNKCCFCEMSFFDPNGWHSWKKRLAHIASIHHHVGHRLAAARPTFDLLEYLGSQSLISRETYNYVKGPPVTPGYSSQSGSSNHSASVNMNSAYTVKSSSKARDRGRRLTRR